jgi:hypothetical protein
MKKLFFVLTAIFLLINQPVKAATFNYTPSGDMYYLQGEEYGSNNNSAKNGDYLGVYKTAASSFETYLKFNLLKDIDNKVLDLTKEKISSVSLKIYLDKSNDKTVTSAYFVNDDSWIEPAYSTYLPMTKPVINTGEFLGDLNTNSVDKGYKTIDLNANIFNNNLNEIKANNLISVGMVTTGTDYAQYLGFYSKEYNSGLYTPTLTINTTPVPEPSSLILGVMSIAGVAGIRKRKA